MRRRRSGQPDCLHRRKLLFDRWVSAQKHRRFQRTVTGALLPWDPGCNTRSTSSLSGRPGLCGRPSLRVGGEARDFAAAADLSGAVLPGIPPGRLRDCDRRGAIVHLSERSLRQGRRITRSRFRQRAQGQWAPAVVEPNGVGEALSMAVVGNEIYAGGFIQSIGGTPRSYLASIAETLAQLLEPGANNTVNHSSWMETRSTWPESSTKSPELPRSRLAALDTNGALLPWDPSADDSVNQVIRLGNRLYAGGYFTTMARRRDGSGVVRPGRKSSPLEPTRRKQCQCARRRRRDALRGGRFRLDRRVSRQGFARFTTRPFSRRRGLGSKVRKPARPRAQRSSYAETATNATRVETKFGKKPSPRPGNRFVAATRQTPPGNQHRLVRPSTWVMSPAR